VLDADGEVVALTVAASSGSTTETVDGYAIPIARVLEVVQQVESGDESGGVVIGGRAFLGVQLDATGSTTLAGVIDDTPAAELSLGAWSGVSP
jgi:S1-C subfamily serine protease